MALDWKLNYDLLISVTRLPVGCTHRKGSYVLRDFPTCGPQSP